ELSERGVAIARTRAPQARFLRRDLLVDGETDPSVSRWATHAVCSEVLEHVDEPERLLANSAAFLAPDARVIVTVPGGPMSAFDRHIGHRRHFTPAALAGTLGKAGYEVEMVSGAGFPFFNLYRLLVILQGQRLVEEGCAGDRRKVPIYWRI